eukprot:COSAG02_NODE_244_length_27402_cov_41.050397_24_plen_143_part_00
MPTVELGSETKRLRMLRVLSHGSGFLPRAAAAACYCLACCQLAPIGVEAATVKLSNVALPTDQYGQKLITGEADVLKHNDTYYLYFNNWGPCPGVDCCKTAAGCATCCFARYAAALHSVLRALAVVCAGQERNWCPAAGRCN